ncbi:MAG: SMP-30/gluconolactonase/LRE family protein [Rhodospirillales bacterium]|nr:SMP-30/gluconolactonase/LRE family protein [Rhodospirillales bacterium]
MDRVKAIDLKEIDFIGAGLQRPECVQTCRSGHLFASNWQGGISILSPDGEIKNLLALNAGFDLKPNGFCLMDDGSFLIAHLGDEDGGVFHLHKDGTLEPFLTEVDGIPLPPTNYVHRDQKGRIWITVSTRLQPRALGYRADVSDGFIILADLNGARIAADNLGYTNECLVTLDGASLLAVETFARRLSQFTIEMDGSLSDKKTIAEFGGGTFPDGVIQDREGGIWVTGILSNRVIHIDTDGQQTIILEDYDPAELAIREQAFQDANLGRSHLDTLPGARLRNITSLAFGGPDLKTAYLGCLLGDSIASFPSPVAGNPPVHWELDGSLYFNADNQINGANP